MSLDLTLIYSQFNFEMTKLRNQNVYEFEYFRLDAAHLLLYKNGQEIPLAPKVVETLLFLVENSGKVISKDELMEKVWADSIVEESNLSQNLFRLRKILGDTKDGKPFIETLRRRGYRFVPKVSVAGTEEEVSNPELTGLSNKEFVHADLNSTNGKIPDALMKPFADETRNLSSKNEIQNLSQRISRTPRRKSSSRARLLLGFVALIIVAGSIVFALSYVWQTKQSGFKETKLRRLTESGNLFGAAISPDGNSKTLRSGSKIFKRKAKSSSFRRRKTNLARRAFRRTEILFTTLPAKEFFKFRFSAASRVKLPPVSGASFPSRPTADKSPFRAATRPKKNLLW